MGDWIGVDLDGTLAKHESHRRGGRATIRTIGDPLWPMVERVRTWVDRGQEVKILTARVCSSLNSPEEIQKEIKLIQDWLETECLLPRLAVTAEKDYGMIELWDDRAIQVISNVGDPKYKESGS